MDQFEDHKTYIPGVGFLVTSWDGSESGIFPTPAEEGISEGEKKWEIFMSKVESGNEGVDQELSDDEMDVAYDVFAAGGSVEAAIAKVVDHAAQRVVEYFENDGQPTMYEEYQDLDGGDDWDHGQYDEQF